MREKSFGRSWNWTQVFFVPKEQLQPQDQCLLYSWWHKKCSRKQYMVLFYDSTEKVNWIIQPMPSLNKGRLSERCGKKSDSVGFFILKTCWHLRRNCFQRIFQLELIRNSDSTWMRDHLVTQITTCLGLYLTLHREEKVVLMYCSPVGGSMSCWGRLIPSLKYWVHEVSLFTFWKGWDHCSLSVLLTNSVH